MPTTGVVVTRDPVSVWMPNYQIWVDAITQVVENVLLARQDEIEQWMKANHVWKNRTTLAEKQLFAKTVRGGLVVSMVMGHGWDVYYSRFLEKWMQGGRFSVLLPALDYWGSVLLADVQRALK